MISLSLVAEFLSLSVAVVNYKQLKGTLYIYFIPFLFYVCYSEVGAWYFNVQIPNRSGNGNTHIYLWVSIFEMLFYSYLFIRFIRNEKIKKIIGVIAAAVIIAYLFLFLFYEVYVEVYYSIMAGVGIYMTVLSCIYFYDLFHREEEEDVIALPEFWVIAGIFVFYIGTCLTFLLHHALRQPHVKIFGMPLYNLVAQALSIILYGFFAKAFILCRKKTT